MRRLSDTFTKTLLALGLASVIAPSVQAEPSTFDADSLSEIIDVTIENDKSLSWQTHSSTGSYGATSSQGTFGQSGNHLIPADWNAAGDTTIGVISKGTDNNVTWYTKAANSQLQSNQFGTSRHTFVSGGDYDGNGIADAAIVDSRGNATIRANMFTSPSDAAFKFGSKAVSGAELLFFDEDGDGEDLLCAVKRQRFNRIPRFRWTCFDNTGTKTTGRMNGVAQKKATEVLPVQSSGGSDYMAFVVGTKRGTVITVRDISGSIVERKSYRSKGTVIVGDFHSDSGEEIMIQRDSSFVGFNPGTKTEFTLNVDADIAVDHVNVNKFSSKKNKKKKSGGGSGGSGPGGGCSGGSVGVGFGMLWKPAADASDARAGKPVWLETGSRKSGKRGSINIYDRSGNKVCSLGFKASSIPGVNNGADHYFAGWSGGCSKYASQMPNPIYIEWKGNQCVGPINPRSRTGGI